MVVGRNDCRKRGLRELPRHRCCNDSLTARRGKSRGTGLDLTFQPCIRCQQLPRDTLQPRRMLRRYGTKISLIDDLGAFFASREREADGSELVLKFRLIL